MTRMVRARKKHRCGACGGMIRPGKFYALSETREPMYTENTMGYDVQVGIEYIRVRLCLECCSTEAFGFN